MAAVLLLVRFLQVRAFGAVPATVPYTALFVLIGAVTYFAVLLILKDKLVSVALGTLNFQ